MRRPPLRAALLTLAALALSGAPARADNTGVERTFLERAAISAADRACDLFSDGERHALASGLYQTEGELLRAGYDSAKVGRLAAEVGAHARSLGCEHPSVRDVAATVRDSYGQFQKIGYLEYPAAHGVWAASRSLYDRWAVSQTDAASGVMLGLRRPVGASTADDLRLAVALPAGVPAPSAVQIFVRDPRRLAEPWLGPSHTLKPAARKLSALAPAPRSMARPEWASDVVRETDSAGAAIRVFYFPAAVIARLEALDPREAIQLELTPSPRAADKTPVRILFETGDLRAAHHFVLIPGPTYAPPKK
ncbi:MAG: hypothetical protein SGJ21_09075 [Alphaproteobacteria bacterium]|nr:hypothetical protein [Alphaproteobacteria bacterium]